MGNCNSTYEYQPPSRLVLPDGEVEVDVESAARYAKQASEALRFPLTTSDDPVERLHKAVKYDPENLQYRLDLMRLMGQRWSTDGTYVKIWRVYRDARDRGVDRTGQLEVCYVEATLAFAAQRDKRDCSPFPMSSVRKALLHGHTLNDPDLLVQFARGQREIVMKTSMYSVAVLHYEVAYIAEAHPQHLVSLAELVSVGPDALTDAPVAAFRRAEAACHEMRAKGGADIECDQCEVSIQNFAEAEQRLREGSRLITLGDLAGAEAQARLAIEIFPRSARPYRLLWQCIDMGGDDSQYLNDLEAVRHRPATNFDSSWLVDCSARKGMFLITQGEYEEGMKLLKWALSNESNNERWRAAQKQAEARKLGDEAEYLEAFSGVTDITTLRNAALQYHRRGEFLKSARILELAIEQKADRYTERASAEQCLYAVLHGERADSLYKAGRYAEAAQEYQTACSFSGMYESLYIWNIHQSACEHLAEKPDKPLPRELVWLKAHDDIHGGSTWSPAERVHTATYGSLADDYARMQTLVALRRAVDMYEEAWNHETDQTLKTGLWARRTAVGAEILRRCPEPVYVESEEHKRLRMQNIVSMRRQRAKMDVPQGSNWYF